MKVAVLGSGNGAHATAFEWARAGHDVYMFDFPQFSKSIDAIAEAGGIYSEGVMEGFQKIVYAGTDISKVVPDADVIFAVGPAYATEAFGKACAPYIERDQLYVVMPGSCMGAVTFKRALGLAVEDGRLTVAETHTLPYAVRIIGPAKIAVYNRLPGGYYVASIPRENNEAVYELLRTVYPEMLMGDSVLMTTLQNGNPVIHPSITTLNAALIERTHGDFFFYHEGVTPAVGRLIKGVDDERLKIGEALGIKLRRDPEISIDQGYMVVNSYDEGYNTSPGFDGIKAQSQLDYRYYNEDVGYTMLFWIDLADRLGVDVPLMKAMVKVVSTIMGRDYAAEAPRTLESLGLGDYTAEDLREL